MLKNKLTIIDADSIIYTIAYRFKNSKVAKLVEINTSKFISDILVNSNSTHYLGFYGSKEEGAADNFRFDVYNKYKANRPPTPDFVIKWRPLIHKVFKDKWGFIPVEGMEADDAVAICHAEYINDYEITVATADKDLRQLADITFYDFNKHKTDKIDKFTAAYNINKQLLMGDTSDNIPGLPGIGKVNAAKLLTDCTSIYGLQRKVILTYKTIAETLRKKESSRLADKIKLALKEDVIEEEYADYKGLQGARLERRIRINLTTQLATYMDLIIPGGWKTYYKQQRSLLLMLTKPNEYFTIPQVLDNPLISLIDTNEQIVENQTQAESNINDFLTI